MSWKLVNNNSQYTESAGINRSVDTRDMGGTEPSQHQYIYFTNRPCAWRSDLAGRCSNRYKGSCVLIESLCPNGGWEGRRRCFNDDTATY